MRSVETVLFLVVVAAVVAAFARRLAVPAPSLLVVAGLLIGLIPGVPEIRVTPEVVSLFVLPPLLYAAGEEMPWRELRQVWRPVTVLAVGLVLFTAAAVGFLATAVAPLTASMGFVLGAVLASTDPVAVAALGRRLSLPTRLQVLVQAESLFNDATSLVLFRVAVAAAVAGGAIAPGPALGEFALLAVGGTLHRCRGVRGSRGGTETDRGPRARVRDRPGDAVCRLRAGRDGPRVRRDRGDRGRDPARPAVGEAHDRTHPAAARRGERHGDLHPGERRVQPDRAAAAHVDPVARRRGHRVAAALAGASLQP